MFLTSAQLRDLARFADMIRPGEGSLVTLLGFTGLRWGEVVALRCRSIDMVNSQIHVKEAATEIGGRLVFSTPKTHRQRMVVVPKSVMLLLESRLFGKSPDDLVFTAPKGGPLRSSNYRKKVWLPSVRGLAETHEHLVGLRIHDLRHTAASLAISCEANIKAIQRMLGHRHASMTLDRYGHLYTEDLVVLAERLDLAYQDAA